MKPDLLQFLQTFATKTNDLVGTPDVLAEKRRIVKDQTRRDRPTGEG